MKVPFFRVFWPSLVASIIVLVLLVVFIFSMIGAVSGGKPDFQVKENTVLHMKLSGEIGEMSSVRFDPGVFSVATKIGLADVLYALQKAEKDPKVKGLFLELESPVCGYATAAEIRNAINQFEESGKFVISYFQGEAVGLKQYFIASAANESYGFPSTMMEFGGLGAELMFYKGLLDKLDVEVQVVRGSNNDFKSAVEPFFRKSISDSSRVQLERYLNSMWEDITTDLSDEKGLTVNELNEIADSTYIRRLTDAVDFKFINDVKYRDEVLAIIAEKVNEKSVDDLNLMSFEKYAKRKFGDNQRIAQASKSNVAVIIAEGGVVKSGDGLSSDRITKLFREVREDDNIKTVVFRVNSPGGSALASDEIWREVMLTKAKKPVIVSMGDVAASGGYYIAAPASRIFAEARTITGSIGVFGMIPYTGKMFEEKLGITFDRVSTNHRAVLSTNKKLSEEEFKIVQDEVDYIYDEFLMRVAEGRGMSKEAVNEVARGRVWTGKDALKIGLVDQLGGFNDALAYAIEDAGIEDAKILYYPKVKKEPWEEILEVLNADEELEDEMGLPSELLMHYKKVKELESRFGIQARLPYDIVIR